MTRKILLAVTLVTATTIAGAAFADTNHGHKGRVGSNDVPGTTMQERSPGMMGNMDGMQGMMKMMQRMHGSMMGGGMMDRMGPMDGSMMRMFDTDADGTATPEELRAQLQDKLTEYDSDGDGNLSISEFEIFHSAMIRETMVDRFQHLDADGDGALTGEEMTAPADRMQRMQKMRVGQGREQTKPENSQEMGDGDMMKDN